MSPTSQYRWVLRRRREATRARFRCLPISLGNAQFADSLNGSFDTRLTRDPRRAEVSSNPRHPQNPHSTFVAVVGRVWPLMTLFLVKTWFLAYLRLRLSWSRRVSRRCPPAEPRCWLDPPPSASKTRRSDALAGHCIPRSPSPENLAPGSWAAASMAATTAKMQVM